VLTTEREEKAVERRQDVKKEVGEGEEEVCLVGLR